MQKSDKTNHLRDALKALDSAVDEWNSLTNKALPPRAGSLTATQPSAPLFPTQL